MAFSFVGGADNAALMAKGVRKLDLGGQCGNVMVINGSNSNFEQAVREYFHDDEISVPKSEASNLNVMAIFPKWDEAVYSEVPVIRIRIELNIYSNGNDAACKITARSNGVDHATRDAMSPGYFRDDDGKWDPTKWAVVELTAPGLVKVNDLQIPAFLKLANVNANGAVLIRKISYFADSADKGESAIYGLSMSVGAEEAPMEAPVEVAAEDISKFSEDGMVLYGHTIKFVAPEGHEIWYKVEHSPACTHIDCGGVQAASDNADNADADGFVSAGTNEYVYTVATPGHTELVHLKTYDTNALKFTGVKVFEMKSHPNITGLETVGVDAGSASAELYNLEGVRVDAATAAPGIYVERRGAVARKVVR